MSKQLPQIILFFTLSLLSYATWKYFFDREESVIDKPFTKGYSVENVELKITDDLGKLTAKFTSPNLTKFTNSEILHIEAPLFWTYNQGKLHWLLKSNTALYDTTKGIVEFPEEVVASTIDPVALTEFKANNLTMDMNTKKASTNDGVNFKQQNMTMTGQIARFDLVKETLEVSNNVKAVYTSQYKQNE